MIDKIRSLTYGELGFIGGFPIALWILGFLLTGAQVFDPNASVENETAKPQVVENVTPKVDISLDGTEKQMVENERNKEKDADKDRFGIKSLDEIKDKNRTITDISSPVSSDKDDESEIPKPLLQVEREEPKTVASRPAKRSVAKEAVIEEESTEEDTDVDPYANFAWKGSTYQSPGAEANQADNEPGRGEVYVEGSFLRDEVIKIGVTKSIQIINNESIDLGTGQIIAPNTALTGFITYSKDRMFINIPRVTTRKIDVSSRIEVYDNTYSRGILVRAESDGIDDARDEGNDLVNQALRGVQVNTPVGNVSLPRLRSKDGGDAIRVTNSSVFKLLVQ